MLDNADNLPITQPFWPISGHGAVLVASQNRASGFQLANNGMEAKAFSPEEITTWFCQQLGRNTVLDEETRKVTESFGHHTLTIKQMASYIRES